MSCLHCGAKLLRQDTTGQFSFEGGPVIRSELIDHPEPKCDGWLRKANDCIPVGDAGERGVRPRCPTCRGRGNVAKRGFSARPRMVRCDDCKGTGKNPLG